jgi:ubiquinone/menaquinone biosynthesis C-methylase UbiE
MALPNSISPARLYELAYYWRKPRDERFLRFLTTLLSRHAPGRRVLDCACGTGEPGIHLTERFLVTFADASSSMLRIAKEKAAAKGLEHPRFRKIAWIALSGIFYQQFDSVLCCGNAITQCLDIPSRKASLRGMAGALASGGVLYLDFREISTMPTARQFSVVDVAGPVFWARRSLHFVIFERMSGGILHRLKVCYSSEGTRLRPVASSTSLYLPVTKKEIRAELLDLGFSAVSFAPRPGNWPLSAAIAVRGTRS